MKFKLFSVPTLLIVIVVFFVITTLDIMDWLVLIFCGIFIAIIIGLIKIFAWIKSRFASHSHYENSQRDGNNAGSNVFVAFDDDDDDNDFDDDDDDFDDDDDDDD